MSEAATTTPATGLGTRVHHPLIPVPGWFAPVSLGIAAVAALALVDEPIGLGFTLTLIALYVAGALVIGRSDRFTIACWTLAGALAAIATLRTAGWLVALCVAGSLILAAVAATEARTWKQLTLSVGRATAGLAMGPATLFGLLGKRRQASKAGPVLRGLLVALPLLVIFGALFASADAVFRSALDEAFGWLPDIDLILPVRVFVFFLIAAAAGGLVWTASRRDAPVEDRPQRRRPLGQTEWTVALGALVALFAMFVGVQAIALVQGHAYVLETAGLTYAEYVHEGFAQQMLAAALTLTVVAGAWHLAAREDESADRRLRLLLGALCVFTLAILGSSIWRVDLYMDAFGATRLRILVIVTALWMAGLFVLVIAAGARERAPWLPRAVVLFSAGVLMALALANPDAWIAQRNADRYTATGKIDEGYLEGLSDDAVPVLAGLETPDGQPLMPMRDRIFDLTRPEGAAGFNVGRDRARDALFSD